MPVTRSSSHQPRPEPFPSSTASRTLTRNVSTARNSADIIVALSDEELPPSKKISKRKNAKPTPQPRVLSPLIDQEIIEISSDDESPAKPRPTAVHAPSPEPAAIAGFRRQISKYREEAAKSKKDLEKVSKEAAELRIENKELQSLWNTGNGKITLDTKHLVDQMECEICTFRMWTPYVLPNCGHTFCQSCLQDWFSATQAQFMANNPTYNPNQLISAHNVAHLYNLVQNMMHNPHTANSPQLVALAAQLLPSYPQYTCPTCREAVTSRPIEVFALKALLRTITTAMGESSPKRPKHSDKVLTPSPWDGFFPRREAAL